MNAEPLSHVFEPYSTGAGLGLATVYGIVRQPEGDRGRQ